MKLYPKSLLIALLGSKLLSAAPTHQAQIVVYGDTSGGVTAAIQSARMGKSTILVSLYGHPGGMTTSGLGWTDMGNPAILGGLSREFYHRLYKHYENDSAWQQEKRSEYSNRGQGTPALNAETELASTFEPKAAEQVFRDMLAEYKDQLTIIEGYLNLDQKALKDGTRITTITLEDGTTIRGNMFIDASYEGDLLEAAGVSFTVGREANATYNEHGNGIVGIRNQHQFRDGISPYTIPNKPESGLLPGINPDMGGQPGDADHRFQAYCYRMVLTDSPKNRVTINKPANYDAKDYELLFRAIDAGKKDHFFKLDLMPNRKTDSNNNGPISTDYIGMNYGKDWNWATLNHQQRTKLAAQHRDWQLGLLWTLQNHPRVAEAIRQTYAKWGLPKDEFTDNNHWPYNLYIREARRMVSDFVMTEAVCRRQTPVEDPIGLGAYTLDSHHTQRVAHNGMVKNEGDIQEYTQGKAYGIAYRAITPRTNECENLLVPWALSASHIAFGSIRMEPVFMILGQSAATAASIAIDHNSSVQNIPYNTLKTQLLKDNQRLIAPDRARPTQ